MTSQTKLAKTLLADYGVVHTFESLGAKAGWHAPQLGTSGVTSTHGVDFGLVDEKALASMILSPETRKVLRGAMGLKRVGAGPYLKRNQAAFARISKAEIAEIRDKTYASQDKSLRQAWGKAHPNVPIESIDPRRLNVLASVAFQFGAAGVPNFMKLIADKAPSVDLVKSLKNFVRDRGPDGKTQLYDVRRQTEIRYILGKPDVLFKIPKKNDLT